MPIIDKLSDTYKLWQKYLQNFPNTSRFTLGYKIDLLFVEVIEQILIASHKNSQEKLPNLRKATEKFDRLKFFLKIVWQNKILDNKKYITISEKLFEIGKMLGGWEKSLLNKNFHHKMEE